MPILPDGQDIRHGLAPVAQPHIDHRVLEAPQLLQVPFRLLGIGQLPPLSVYVGGGDKIPASLYLALIYPISPE